MSGPGQGWPFSGLAANTVRAVYSLKLFLSLTKPPREEENRGSGMQK